MLASLLLRLGSVFLVGLAHEELAIIAGAILVAELGFSAPSVALVLALSMVAGDVLLYGLGRLARSMPALRALEGHARLRHPADWMRRHVFLVIMAARFFPGPGAIFPVMTGCGLLGVSVTRFIVASAVSSALYAPLGLAVVLAWEGVVGRWLGWWAWPLLLALLIGVSVVLRPRPGAPPGRVGELH